MRFVIAWATWGPYHHARFEAFRDRCAREGIEAVGLEMYDESSVYGWERSARLDVRSLSLPGDETRYPTPRAMKLIWDAIRDLAPAATLLPAYNNWSLAMTMAARANASGTVVMSETTRETARPGSLRKFARTAAVRWADAMLVGGAPHRRYFANLGVPDEQIFDGYDVVDNDFFARSAAAPLTDEAIRLEAELPASFWLSVARLTPKKSLHTLLQAHAIARERLGHDSPSLVIIGGGELRPALERFAADLGSPLGPDGVQFIDTFEPAAVARAMGLAEALVLPSAPEEWGLVVNEAMAAGCPTIVSTGAGCHEDLVSHGQTGLSFPAGHSGRLADCLLELHGDRGLRERLVSGGRARISAWALDRFADNGYMAAAVASKRRRGRGT